MKKAFATLCLLISYTSYADVPPNQAKEVNHLLNFVKQSHCTINRNGTEHAGQKAGEHIEKKYLHFKNDIKSTEDFIQYSATKSTLSDNYYKVSCPNQKTMKTQQWLLNELAQFRKNNMADNLKPQATICTDPRPQICTMEYVPVCATFNNKTTKTYASACSACSDKNVISHQKIDC